MSTPTYDDWKTDSGREDEEPDDDSRDLHENRKEDADDAMHEAFPQLHESFQSLIEIVFPGLHPRKPKPHD